MAKNLTLIIVLVIVLIIIVAGIYYFMSLYSSPVRSNTSQNNSLSNQQIANNQPEKKPVITPEQQQAQINKDFPETITGIINFLDVKSNYKTTIKTGSGKVYTFWPPQPESIYGAQGVKNGQEVQVQGKINSQGTLEWATIKPI